MSPALSLQTFPTQRKHTSGSPVASGSQKLSFIPRLPTSVQCQGQVPTQFPIGQQAPQA